MLCNINIEYTVQDGLEETKESKGEQMEQLKALYIVLVLLLWSKRAMKVWNKLAKVVLLAIIPTNEMYDGRSTSPAALDTHHFSCSLNTVFKPPQHMVRLGQHISVVGLFDHAFQTDWLLLLQCQYNSILGITFIIVHRGLKKSFFFCIFDILEENIFFRLYMSTTFRVCLVRLFYYKWLQHRS